MASGSRIAMMDMMWSEAASAWAPELPPARSAPAAPSPYSPPAPAEPGMGLPREPKAAWSLRGDVIMGVPTPCAMLPPRLPSRALPPRPPCTACWPPACMPPGCCPCPPCASGINARSRGFSAKGSNMARLAPCCAWACSICCCCWCSCACAAPAASADGCRPCRSAVIVPCMWPPAARWWCWGWWLAWCAMSAPARWGCGRALDSAGKPRPGE
mmetsp:Transcript_17708/g.44603  ORF Transcript_17708/g.44603 Transcript_17708/m.44603 type:complete len:214 (-) Transcript_17708:932-1573(-)